MVNDNEFISLCENLKEELTTYLGEVCMGFYIFGSCMTGGYQNTSDIDFICILSKPVDSALLLKITAIHDNVSSNRYGRILEGEYHYLPNNQLCEREIIEVHQGREPFIDRGTIDPDVVEMIKRGNFRVFGKDFQYTLPYFSATDLQLYYQKYLEHLYNKVMSDKIDHPDCWAVLLNACRAYYCIVNRNFIPCKETAAIWASGCFPEHKKIIETAIQVRNGMEGLTLTESDVSQLRKLLCAMVSDLQNFTDKVGFQMPMRTEIQVNTACNCSCPHCGYDTVTGHRSNEMTLQTITSYLTEVKECWGWIDRVLFEGGEATLSAEKLLQCIMHAKSLNIPNIQLNTNMVNVSTDLCEALIDAGCNYFEISVDAISRSGWQKMRGLECSAKKDIWHDGFLKSVEYLCKYSGIEIDFNFTATSVNIGEIEDVYRFACNHGVNTFSFQNLICTCSDNKAISLSRDAIMDAISRCVRIAECYANPPTILVCCSEVLRLPTHEYEQKRYVSFLRCDSGEKYIYINHKQELRKCCFGHGGDIGIYKEGTFARLWKNRKCPAGCMFA